MLKFVYFSNVNSDVQLCVYLLVKMFQCESIVYVMSND